MLQSTGDLEGGELQHVVWSMINTLCDIERCAQRHRLTMPLGLANSRLIWVAMSVAFSGNADASVLTPWKKGMQIGCAQTRGR